MCYQKSVTCWFYIFCFDSTFNVCDHALPARWVICYKQMKVCRASTFIINESRVRRSSFPTNNSLTRSQRPLTTSYLFSSHNSIANIYVDMQEKEKWRTAYFLHGIKKADVLVQAEELQGKEIPSVSTSPGSLIKGNISVNVFIYLFTRQRKLPTISLILLKWLK